MATIGPQIRGVNFFGLCAIFKFVWGLHMGPIGSNVKSTSAKCTENFSMRPKWAGFSPRAVL